jgi:two-component sensor histidine kinase
VSDNGVGLPPDFEQRRTQSLGLQLASDLARQLGGRLTIGPTEGNGTGASFAVVFSAGRVLPSTQVFPRQN